jgi:hypothetical protein
MSSSKASLEQAQLLIERAEALGEGPDDPAVVVLGPLRLLGHPLLRVQRS